MTLKAEADIAAVLAWFRDQQALEEGGRWVAALLRVIGTLENHPLRCGIADESADIGTEIRQLLFGKRHGKYRVLFQIDGRTVDILRVRHGAQDRVASDDL